jgi:hypothetical protein
VDKVAKTFNITANQVFIARSRIADVIRLEVERLGKEML